jgi:single-stranded DNA-binding protein
MNHCIFTGFLLFDPELDDCSEGAASLCIFKLVTYEYVRNKRGQKMKYPTTITLQAWDSGADAIVKLGKEGMKMTVYASARNGNLQTDASDDVIFRVNQFDFACIE